MTQTLQSLWRETANAFNIPLSAQDLLWNDIKTRYQEPQRFYHTLAHLEDIFQYYHVVKKYLKTPHHVTFALFYHDIIYDPKSPSNEEDSVDHIKTCLSPYLKASDVAAISAMILATKTHKTKERKSDTAYLIDIDMSIFASSKEKYQTYLRQIEKEYAWVDASTRLKRRRDVFLIPFSRDTIFHTDYFKTHFEHIAQHNIQTEIALINKELIKLKKS